MTKQQLGGHIITLNIPVLSSLHSRNNYWPILIKVQF